MRQVRDQDQQLPVNAGNKMLRDRGLIRLCFPAEYAMASGTRLAGTLDHVFEAGELVGTDRAAGMQLAG